MIKRIACVLHICLFLSTAGVSHGLVRFDFEQPYFIESGQVVKDHSLIRVGAVYHLFYLRGNPAVNIGHATSGDLIHWDLEPPVLYVEPGTWDEKALWAPEILQSPESQYYLYYTGVNNSFSQQTGLALSIDLAGWEKFPWPVYHPDPSWANWTDSTWSNGRDPFIFEYDGINYLLVTASTSNNKGAIASARSDDFVHWEDNGPIYVHDSWHAIESVQCIVKNSKFHLFFSEEAVGGTSHMYSNSLYNGWDISKRTIIDLGQAPEVDYFDGEYLLSRHGVYYHEDGSRTYMIRFDPLAWSGNTPFVPSLWPLRNKWNFVEGTAFLFQPTFENNPLARGDSIDVGFEGNCWIGTYERFQGPLTSFPQGDTQGDGPTGVIQSDPFVITGNSMNLLVGGGYYPAICYVAMRDASTGLFIFLETGADSDEMTRRYWDLTPHKGQTVYIEIADKSMDAFGHICVDDITESMDIINPVDPDDGSGRSRDRIGDISHNDQRKTEVVLHQNSPNPFNPITTIPYYLPAEAQVTLNVYNVNGALIRTLVNTREADGPHRVFWDGRNDYGALAAAGIYFYRLTVDGKMIDTKKMVFLK
jgi:predicted GH43/DUF377 family glycosyl hydrolase